MIERNSQITNYVDTDFELEEAEHLMVETREDEGEIEDEPDELEYEQMDLEQQEQMDEELEELEQLELELASNQLANNRRWDFPEMAHLSIARSLRTESAPDRLETVPYLVIPAAQPSTSTEPVYTTLTQAQVEPVQIPDTQHATSTEPVSTALTVLTEPALIEIPATLFNSVQTSTSGTSTAP